MISSRIQAGGGAGGAPARAAEDDDWAMVSAGAAHSPALKKTAPCGRGAGIISVSSGLG